MEAAPQQSPTKQAESATEKPPFVRVTEQTSYYDNLDKMSVRELCTNINKEDQTVPLAIAKAMDQIVALSTAASEAVKNEGRIIYFGAGTSGRLAILDASECPPTYGIPDGVVIGIIAGGDKAIRKAQEGAEDNVDQAWRDLSEYLPDQKDVIIGVTASATTPYVIGGIREAKKAGIKTGCIVCNANSVLSQMVDYPVEVVTGPEFVTGSTRMKAGTAQKLVLNMVSTTAMIQYGRVRGNRMIDMKLSNDKLVDRGTKMVANDLKISYEEANKLLLEAQSVRRAIDLGRQRKADEKTGDKAGQ